MPRYVTSLGIGRKTNEFFQGTSVIRNSKTCEDVSIMVSSMHRTPRRREEHTINATSIQSLSSLMEFLYKEIWKYLSNTTSINVIST